MILGASVEPLVMALPFDEVAQDLAQEQNLVRIKKLLIYSCTQVWEGDRQRLEQVSLLSLLQDLRAIAPTVEQLQSRLDFAVHSLSKAAEYALVSNVIMSHVSRLYPAYPDTGTQISLADENVYGAIAQRLQQHRSGDRIKKLLLLACKGTWISDLTQLAQVNITDLIQDLHRLTPSLSTLQAALESLVNTLNKPAEYALAADAIISAFQPLYPETMTEIRTAMPDKVAVLLSSTALANAPQASSALSQTSDLANLFDLRLEIMQYANPYRAKIVLFSLLHQPFANCAEDESLIKNQTLDDLLRSMLQTYKLSDVEVQLLAVAKNLEDSEDCLQVAKVILGAVKPFYAHLPNRLDAEKTEDATAAFVGANPAERTPSADDRGDDSADDRGEGAIAPSIPNSILAH